MWHGSPSHLRLLYPLGVETLEAEAGLHSPFFRTRQLMLQCVAATILLQTSLRHAIPLPVVRHELLPCRCTVTPASSRTLWPTASGTLRLPLPASTSGTGSYPQHGNCEYQYLTWSCGQLASLSARRLVSRHRGGVRAGGDARLKFGLRCVLCETCQLT